MEKETMREEEFDRKVKEALRVFKRGDRRACGELLGLLWPLVERFARSRADADWERRERFLTDIAEIFPALLDGYRERECLFSSWLYAVLSNRWYFLRRQRESGLVRSAFPVEPIVSMQENGSASPLITALARRERFLLQLRYPELLQEGDLETMRACGFLREGSGDRVRTRLRSRLEQISVFRRRAEDRLSSLYLKKIQLHCRGGTAGGSRLRQLARVTDRLSERLRRSMVTLSYREIAECTGIPTGTVASLIYRGRRKIRLTAQGNARRVS